jgi:hypothetical protein
MIAPMKRSEVIAMNDAQKEKLRANLAKARAKAAENRAMRHAAAVPPVEADPIHIDEELEAIAAHDDAPPARAPIHEPTRTPMRAIGRNEAVGRNGEVLSRKRTQAGDIFDVPKELIPAGWELQWCAVTVTGNSEILLDQNLMFAENGWRPVPADRYPGRFMPVGHKGSIIRGGQMLMERPKSLSDEARAEDVRLARQLISDRNESLKLSGMKRQMAVGFEMGGKYRGTGGDIRMSIDRALDAPAPVHPLADE